MKNYSIWKEEITKINYPKLNKDTKTNVLIIGGGITGISTYYQLKKQKMDVLVVEQGSIGMSTTANSTGKLSFLQNDLIDKIRVSLGDEVARKYVMAQIDGIKLAKEIIEKEKINCDLEKINSKLYANSKKDVKSIKDLESFFHTLGIKTFKTTSSLVKSKYMFEVENTYLFHPLKFIFGLIKQDDHIYENTCIKKICKKNNYYICFTDNYKIKTKYVILASHYPFFNWPFVFPLKGYLEKSYLSASPYQGDSVSLISYTNPVVSIRNYQDNLIYLSNSHSINTKVCDQENFNELIKKVHNLKLQPNYMWSNIDIMTNDGLPYIGKIKDNMLIATGYNTWGLANGILAGKILCDILTKKNNQYMELFEPRRDNLEQIIGGISSTWKSISGYISGLKEKNKTLITCPHLGCKLLYNEFEEIYDCPCHGSRFDKKGNILMAPANQKITKNILENKKNI